MRHKFDGIACLQIPQVVIYAHLNKHRIIDYLFVLTTDSLKYGSTTTTNITRQTFNIFSTTPFNNVFHISIFGKNL